jgi:hypothetical protein
MQTKPKTERPTLINFKEGSIYFSQMHSLLWQGHDEHVAQKRLYREILLYGLHNTSLVISDSHALQNSWLRNLLKDTQHFPGLKDLFSEGVILIAKRADNGRKMSLLELFEKQKGKAPVIIHNTEDVMKEDFREHAETLEKLSDQAERRYHLSPLFDTGALDLASLMKYVLMEPKIFEKYNIDAELAKIILDRFPTFYDNDKKFMAQMLYAFPEQREYKERFGASQAQNIKKLATSIHSCNFVLTYHIPTSTSTAAFDTNGVMALYENYMREIPFELFSEPSDKEKGNQRLIFPVSRLTPLNILKIRESDTFTRYAKSRNDLFTAFKEANIDSANHALDQFADANLEFVHHILDTLNIHEGNIPKTLQKRLTKMEKSMKKNTALWSYINQSGNIFETLMLGESKAGVQDKLLTTSKKIMLNTNRIINIL